MSLGENIKMLRSKKGLTVREMAKMVGMSPSYLSDIENGRQDPSLKKLRDIAKILEVETYQLLKIYREHQEKNEEEVYTNDEKELIKLYRQLPEEMKAEIRGEIKGILRTVKQQSATKGDIREEVI